MPEAIARVARVIAAGGSKYAALIRRFGVSDYAGDAEQQIGTLLQALLQRGIDDGTFRGDLSAGELGSLLGSLLEAAARSGPGVKKAPRALRVAIPSTAVMELVTGHSFAYDRPGVLATRGKCGKITSRSTRSGRRASRRRPRRSGQSVHAIGARATGTPPPQKASAESSATP